MATGLCQVVVARKPRVSAYPGFTGQPTECWLFCYYLEACIWRTDCHVTTRSKLLRMVAIVSLITTVIQLYIWALLISIILTWLVQFNVINTSNRFVYAVGDFLYKITEPLLGRVRAIIPAIGGIDLSPIVIILLLAFIKQLIPELLLG